MKVLQKGMAIYMIYTNDRKNCRRCNKKGHTPPKSPIRNNNLGKLYIFGKVSGRTIDCGSSLWIYTYCSVPSVKNVNFDFWVQQN